MTMNTTTSNAKAKTATNTPAAPWTVQRENFHWIYTNLRRCDFLGLPYMVEPTRSKVTLSLSNGKLTIKVGADGRTAFTFENGTVSNTSEPEFVPSRSIEFRVRSYLLHIARLGLRY